MTPTESPRVRLESARTLLEQALLHAQQAALPLAGLPGGGGSRFNEELFSLGTVLKEARVNLDGAANESGAWELAPSWKEPAWAVQARRIADAVDDGLWAVNGIPHGPAERKSPVLAALSDSLAVCLARLEAVIAEVRHG